MIFGVAESSMLLHRKTHPILHLRPKGEGTRVLAPCILREELGMGANHAPIQQRQIFQVNEHCCWAAFCSRV